MCLGQRVLKLGLPQWLTSQMMACELFSYLFKIWSALTSRGRCFWHMFDPFQLDLPDLSKQQRWGEAPKENREQEG